MKWWSKVGSFTLKAAVVIGAGACIAASAGLCSGVGASAVAFYKAYGDKYINPALRKYCRICG